MQSNKNWNATSNVNQSSPGCLVVYSPCISKLSKCLHHQRNLNPSSIALYNEISTGDKCNENCRILLHCHLTHRKPLTLMRKLPKLFMKAILLTRLMAMLSEGGVRLLNASRRRCRYIGSVWCCSNWLTKSRYPSW